MRVVTFEGQDGIGKSTQIELQRARLEDEGYKVYVEHFPRYNTPIGSLILSILKGEKEMPEFLAMQMLYVADQLDFSLNINKLKEEGYDYVLLDRFDLSTIVYVCAKFNNEYLYKSIQEWQKGLIQPDLTIILTDGKLISEKDVNKELDAFEVDNELMSNVRRMYLAIGTYLANEKGRKIATLHTEKNKYDTAKKIKRMMNERL